MFITVYGTHWVHKNIYQINKCIHLFTDWFAQVIFPIPKKKYECYNLFSNDTSQEK